VVARRAKLRKGGSGEEAGRGGSGEARGAVVAARMEQSWGAAGISKTTKPGGYHAGEGVTDSGEWWRALRRSAPEVSVETEKARTHRKTGSPAGGALQRVLRLFPNAGAARDAARVPVIPRL